MQNRPVTRGSRGSRKGVLIGEMSLDVDDAIRAKILARMLPGLPQAVDYVAGDSTERCDGCDARILSTDLEYGLGTAGGRVLRFTGAAIGSGLMPQQRRTRRPRRSPGPR